MKKTHSAKMLIAITSMAILITLTLTLLVACSRENESQSIKIGVIQPLTGDVASWGQHGKRAMEIAVEEINTAGGIKGKKLALIVEDSKGDKNVAVNILNKFIDVDKLQIVIGDAISPVSFATAPIASKKKVVLLSPGSTAALLSKEGGDYFFRVMPSDSLQSKITAKWIKDEGNKKVAVISVNNVWGSGLATYFLDEFKNIGGEIVFNEALDEKTSDFKTVISKIKASKPDCIYAPLYQKGAGQFVKQLREMGVKIQVYGADVYEAPEFLQMAGDAAEGVRFTTFVQKDNDISKDFKAKYMQKYNMEPINYAYFAYDAIKIAAKAIESGGYNSAGIRTTLLTMKDFIGATGPNIFDEHGDVTTKTFEKMIVNNGKITAL